MIVVVVGVLVGAYAVGKQHINHKNIQTSSKSNQHKQAVAKLADAMGREDFATAKEQAKIANTDPQAQLLAQANIAYQAGNYKEALNDYQQVEQKYGLRYDLAESIAQVYQQLKDNANAKVYYQKAIDLLKPQNTPLAKEEVPRLQKIVDQLK